MAEQELDRLPSGTHLDLVDWGRFELDLFDVDPTRLAEEASTLPALIAFWGVRLADVESLKQESKYVLARAEAAAWIEVKRQLQKEGQEGQRGRVTEQDVKAAVALHPEVRRAQETLLDDDRRYRQYRAVVSALDGKQSMTASRMGLMRTELQAGMQKQRFNAAQSDH